MANELRYTLDTSNQTYIANKCKQNDDRTLILTLLDNGQPYSVSGAALTLKAKKPDGNLVIQISDITIENNVVTIQLIRDITTIPGFVELELKTVLNSKSITTFTFKLQVEESTIQDEDLQSKNCIINVGELDQKIAEVQNIKNTLEDDIKNGKTDEMRKKIDSISSSLQDYARDISNLGESKENKSITYKNDNGSCWYRKFDDGRLEQGGWLDMAVHPESGSADESITFPVAFVGDVKSIRVTANAWPIANFDDWKLGLSSGISSAESLTTARIILLWIGDVSKSYTTRCWWEAKGWWK